ILYKSSRAVNKKKENDHEYQVFYMTTKLQTKHGFKIFEQFLLFNAFFNKILKQKKYNFNHLLLLKSGAILPSVALVPPQSLQLHILFRHPMFHINCNFLADISEL
ncbi:hypothetical protein BpHYR1_032900, partial [Brachionus plicatilis]